MIIGTLKDLSTYQSLIPGVDVIMRFIDDANFPAHGVWLSINDNLRVIRLNDWNRTSENFETHDRYYDLHFTLKGEDVMNVCLDRARVTVTMAYDQEKDYTLYTGQKDGTIKLEQGGWAFISPNEPHRNEFGDPSTEKLVFKIKVQ